MKRVVLSCCLIMLIGLVPLSPATASDAHVSSGDAKTITNHSEKPATVNPPYHTKANVQKYGAYGSYHRVSNNIKTGPQGGSISSNTSVRLNAEISGNITGLNVNASASVTSTIGYTLNANPNSTCYMACRAYYDIESGVNEYRYGDTGKLISKTNYTVKTPRYLEYTLIYV